MTSLSKTCSDGEIWFVSFSVMFQNFTISDTAAKKVLGENTLQQTLMIFLTFFMDIDMVLVLLRQFQIIWGCC